MMITGQLSVFDVLTAEPEPEPEASDMRPLTLAEVETLEPYRSTVWIETRPW